MSRWSDHRAPVLGGVTLFLAFPPIALALAPFVALVPWIWFVGRQEPGRSGRWRAARSGYVFGVVAFGLLLHWLLVALWPDPWAIPAFCATVLLLALIPALVGWAMHAARDHLGMGLWLGAAVFWTAGEWLAGQPAGLAFPWLGLGTALAAHPLIAGGAELAGARGLTLLVAAVNGLIAAALLETGRRRKFALAGAAAIALSMAAFGAWRQHTIELVPVARVAALQTSIGRNVKHDRRITLDANVRSLESLTGSLPAVDVVVWPEVAVPVILDDEAESARLRALRAVAARAGAPLLVGAYARGGVTGTEAENRRSGSEPDPLHNAAFVVTPGDEPLEMHLKRQLVPFVERTPRGFPGWLAARAGAAPFYGGLLPGPAVRPLRADGIPVGVLICYESAFGGLARRHRLAGAKLLINITNDAWFAPGSGAATVGLWQHALHARMRAIETRTGVVRSANRGLTHFVDPLGRVYDEAPRDRPAVTNGEAYTTDVLTLYVRWGDWIGSAAALAAVILLGAVALAARSDRIPAGRGTTDH